MRIIDLLDRPIAFHRSFVTLTGSITAALMLSQAVYWARRTTDPEGWFYKSQKDWESETGLTRYEQEGARKRLRALGFWHEERRGLPARLYFRIDAAALEEALEKALNQSAPANSSAENRQSSLQKTGNRDCGKPANSVAENPQSLTTEITTETTTEITTEGRERYDPILERRRAFREHTALEETIFKRAGVEQAKRLREIQEISGRRGVAWWGWLREHVAPHMERLGVEFPAGVAAAVRAFHAASDPRRWGLQDFVKALEGYSPSPGANQKPDKNEALAAILADIL